jgi:NADH:ubiquinone oxidoreductase subunit F (NADH-binding)
MMLASPTARRAWAAEAGALGPAASPGPAPAAANFAVLGGRGARLLGGPVRADGTEDWASHVHRLGTLNIEGVPPNDLRELVGRSGLQGRGGAQFPTATKLTMASASRGAPLVVVNASEGEPASRKDRSLVEMRPHLVLDGALVVARAVEATEVVIYLHRGRRASAGALERAIRERPPEGVFWRLVDAPPGYVAGESSAVVAYLDGQGALPRHRSAPAAVRGAAGRPTVVNNVETIAHLALIVRFGWEWFRSAGDPICPGSTLVTLAGEVPVPGVVVEVMAPTRLGELLSTIGGLDRLPQAVLVGGYEGVWLSGPSAWEMPVARGLLTPHGISLGCGVIAVLNGGSCGLATTARLVRWLASESAGQCGSCVFGLPAVSARLDEIANGTALRRDVRRLRQLSCVVAGRGACGHPSGVMALVDSALEVFSAELRRHLHGQRCPAVHHGFPLPSHPEDLK